jgi:hypothetical protein
VTSSIRVSPGVAWEVCEHVNYAGRCRVITSDTPNLLGGGWNDVISSVRRYTGGPGGGGPGGGGTPGTYSTGPINVPQTYSFDLDEGSVTSGSQADIRFGAASPGEYYFAPRNGARIWVGDGSNRNYAGCVAGWPSQYTDEEVSFDETPIGTYVCVRTNAGRISQFRVNGLSPGYPKTLSIGYTTWE